jgi:hypothetical protein
MPSGPLDLLEDLDIGGILQPAGALAGDRVVDPDKGNGRAVESLASRSTLW